MATVTPLHQLVKIDVSNFSSKEIQHFNAMLFVHIRMVFIEMSRTECKEYFRLTHISKEMEDAMLETQFIRSIIRDILLTGHYTLSGIAYYTKTSEEVIVDLAMGRNTTPSASLLHKLYELDQESRPDLYESIGKKMIARYLLQRNNREK